MRFSLKALMAVATYIAVSGGLLAAVSQQSPSKLPGMLAIIMMFGGLGTAIYLLLPKK
jgi:hypothetical protein